MQKRHHNYNSFIVLISLILCCTSFDLVTLAEVKNLTANELKETDFKNDNICESELLTYTNSNFDIMNNDNYFYSTHTSSKHISKSENWILERLSKGDKHEISTYYDKELANKTIYKTINANKNTIAKWLLDKKSKNKLVLKFSGNESLGYSIDRNGSVIKDIKNAIVILKKSGGIRQIKNKDGKKQITFIKNQCKFYVLTSFPVQKLK